MLILLSKGPADAGTAVYIMGMALLFGRGGPGGTAYDD